MNILQINTLNSRGGAARIATQIHRELSTSGHDSRILVKRKGTNDSHVNVISLNLTAHLDTLTDLIGKLIHKDVCSTLRNTEDSIRNFFANDIDGYSTKSIFDNPNYKKADIVHLHNLHGNYFPLKILERVSLSKPIVWTLHDMWAITGHCAHSFECKKYKNGCENCPHLDTPPTLSWDNTKYLWHKKKLIYSQSKIDVVVPSKWMFEKVQHSILKDQNIHLIYNGVNTDVFRPLQNRDKIRKRLGVSANTLVIALAANGGKDNFWKGGKYADKIIHSFIRNKRVVFLNIGSHGTSKKNNIINTGYITNQIVLNELYNASDVFMLTSVAENCPLVVLESMAAGLPVISFNVGGVSELFEKSWIGLVNPYDWNAMGHLIQQIIEKKVSLPSQKALHQWAKTYFSEKQMISQYINLYSQLIV